MKIGKVLVSFALSVTLFSQVSYAQIVTTESLFEKPVAMTSHEKVMQFTARQDVMSALEKMGVEPQMVQERVASMTDEEASMVAQKIDTLPAGADAVGALIGAAVFVFVVLLITDLLGFTKVFNFTHKITN